MTLNLKLNRHQAEAHEDEDVHHPQGEIPVAGPLLVWQLVQLSFGSRWKPYDVVSKVAQTLAPTLDTDEVPEAAAEAAVAVESGW